MESVTNDTDETCEATKDAGIKARIAAFDTCHTKHPHNLTDEQIRDTRLNERYGLDATNHAR